MKILRITNWVLFAGGASMTVMFMVVSLVVGLYHEQIAGIGGNLRALLVVTVAFTVFTLLAGLAAWALHTRHRLMWTGQGVLLLAVAGMLYLSHSLRQI